MKTSPQGFAIFDFSGQIDVQLQVAASLLTEPQNFRIAPASLRIVPHINTQTNTVTFTMPEPAPEAQGTNLTIDPFGDGTRVLHLFTNRPETNVPSQGDPNVLYFAPGDHNVNGQTFPANKLYFGPGVHNVNGQLKLTAGQTLYLAGGAVLRPLVSTKGGHACPQEPHYSGNSYGACDEAIVTTGNNINIRGRGIISGDRALANGVRFGLVFSSGASNLLINDIVVAQSSNWSLHLFNCSNSTVDNVRVLGYFTNSDGIVLNSCNATTVKNSFVHVGDDGLEIKTTKDLPSSNIVFDNSQTWVDAGTPLGLTQEIAANINSAIFRNITVLRYTQPDNGEAIPDRSSILVKPAHGGSLNSVFFQDITIEDHDTDRPLIVVNNDLDVQHAPSGASYSPIPSLLFQRIKANSTRIDTRVMVYDQSQMGDLFDSIRFDNVSINGKTLVEGSVETSGAPQLFFGPPPGC